MITWGRLERTLRFPRNDAADATDSHKVMDAQRALSEDYTSHCSIAQIAASYSRDAAVRDQALAASVQAFAFRSELESFKSEYFLATVKQHAAVEPSTGICDAILVTPVHFGEQNLGILEAKDYLKEFSLVRLPRYKPPKRRRPDKQIQDVAPFGPSSHLSPATASSSTSSRPGPLSVEQRMILKNPLRVSSTESISAPTLSIPEGSPFDSNVILLSGFVAEYKKTSQTEDAALNQERMYLVSTVKFLTVLGIKGFAVFGLMTSGQKGGILMAWQSETNDVRP
jgi:hypothetical protein